MKIDKNSRNGLLSVILGDGYLNKSGGVEIKHSASQLDYLKWKVSYIKKLGFSHGEINYVNNSGFDAYRVYINATKWGRLLRKILYRNGSKEFYNSKILYRLEPIHIAIWYMDDGGLSQKKRGGLVYANELMINTHTTKENNQIIIDYFNERWNVKFSQVKNKGHYRLRCGTKEARKFLSIIREYVSQVPSMAHKLNIKSD